MLRIFTKLNTLMVISILFFGFILSSCKDDEAANSGAVELLSFGPSGVQHGEEIQFIGRNLDKVDAIELPGGVSLTKSQFVSHTPNEIVVVVPQEAGEGKVILKTASGDIESKSILSFEVPVTVTSFNETAKPGENITISGEFVNWITAVEFAEGRMVTDFVSKSINELVVTVPMDAQSGRLIFYTGGTEPLVIPTETSIEVTLPSITGLAPNPVERGAELTISGENLDLAFGVLFKGITDPITQFVSQTPNEIVVVVPVDAGKGVVTLVAYSGLQVESAQSLQLEGDLPPLGPLPYVLYDDARGTGWDNYGWGGATDWASAERVREGDLAAKKTYDGSYDAIRVHNNTAVSVANYTHLTFSVYGGAGTNGKNMQLVINEVWASPYVFPIVEGEWTTYNIPLSELGGHASIGDVLFQSAGWAGVVHYDHIGFK